jgi:hypothetical protein
MSEPMTTGTALTAADLHVISNALETYLSDFTHDDAGLITEIRRVMAKIATLQIEQIARIST